MEVNQAKVWLLAEERGHAFGKVVKMGRNSIIGDEDVGNRRLD
jgi:hypothetical protein